MDDGFYPFLTTHRPLRAIYAALQPLRTAIQNGSVCYINQSVAEHEKYIFPADNERFSINFPLNKAYAQ
jgi:hypothetical protein